MCCDVKIKPAAEIQITEPIVMNVHNREVLLNRGMSFAEAVGMIRDINGCVCYTDQLF